MNYKQQKAFSTSRFFVLPLIVFFVLLSINFLPGNAFAGNNSAPSPTAGAEAISQSKAIGVNANKNINNPTAIGVGGTGIGIGGSASAGVNFHYAPITYIDEEGNRQFLPTGIPAGNGVMNYFGEIKSLPHNVFPIHYGPATRTAPRMISIKEKGFSINQNFTAIETTNIVAYGKVPLGADFVGEGFVVAEANQTTRDAVMVAAREAIRHGADVMEILNSSADTTPVSKSWSIGFGGSGGAIIGPNGTMALSGTSGTNKGESAMQLVTFPFVQVQFWHDGNSNKVGSAAPEIDNKVLPVVYSDTPEKFQAIQK